MVFTLNQSPISRFCPKTIMFAKKKRGSSPKFDNYFLHCRCPKFPDFAQIFHITARKILVLPKYFLVAARKNMILLKFWKLRGNCPPAPPKGTAHGFSLKNSSI